MCYDVQAKLQSQLQRARVNNNDAEFKKILAELERFTGRPMFHLSGFSHPELLIYTSEDRFTPVPAFWGLIPSWVKTEEQASDIRTKTLNARSETIFEKPSFKQSAKDKRCIVVIDGFFEHYHLNGKKYPHFITFGNGLLMELAGLWNEWINESTGEIIRTFSIVTTKANDFMKPIHNNPKLPEPRMPAILHSEMSEEWLLNYDELPEQDFVKRVLAPYAETEMKAYTVRSLRGGDYVGNCEEVTEQYDYYELIYNSTLF